MTEIQNHKQLPFDLIWDLDIVIWNLMLVICYFSPSRRFESTSRRPVYPDLGP
jgi:hypothetical protein